MKTGRMTYWRELASQSGRSSAGGLKGLVDVGSSKVCCYIARNRGQHGFEIAGRGYQAADGFVAGEIADAQSALESILATVQEAEEQAGEQLRGVEVVWSGGNPQTRLLALDRDLGGRQAQRRDIDEMLVIARDETGLDDRVALHVAATSASIDAGKPINDPIGVAGQTMTLEMAVTSVEQSSFGELLELFRRAHLEVDSVINGTHAAAAACLSAEEAALGSLIIDMGGGSTSIGLVHERKLIHADMVPYGGDHVSRDVSIGLETSQMHAERLKSLYGSVQQRSCDDNMWIDVPSMDQSLDAPSTEIPRSKLTMIARARVAETFRLLQGKLTDVMPLFEQRPPRFAILTGGACQIDGTTEMAEELFGLPVRIARPGFAKGARGIEDQPCCSAACGGLVLAAYDNRSLTWKPKTEPALWSGGLGRMQKWLKENFAS